MKKIRNQILSTNEYGLTVLVVAEILYVSFFLQS